MILIIYRDGDSILPLDETIYMEQPEVYETGNYDVFPLLKAIYGLKVKKLASILQEL
jgi:hypothetical protein